MIILLNFTKKNIVTNETLNIKDKRKYHEENYL